MASVNIRELAAKGIVAHARLRDCLCEDVICALFDQADTGMGTSSQPMRRAAVEEDSAAPDRARIGERGAAASDAAYSSTRLNSFSEP